MSLYPKPHRLRPSLPRNAVSFRVSTVVGGALNVGSVGARCADMTSKPAGVVISKPVQARMAV